MLSQSPQTGQVYFNNKKKKNWKRKWKLRLNPLKRVKFISIVHTSYSYREFYEDESQSPQTGQVYFNPTRFPKSPPKNPDCLNPLKRVKFISIPFTTRVRETLTGLNPLKRVKFISID